MISHLFSSRNLRNKLDCSKLITSASDLTLDKFIVCVCDENYHVLVKKNGVKEWQIKKAWDKIYDEYLTILKDREQTYVMQLSRDVELLEFKLNIINFCIKYLDIKNSMNEETDNEVLEVLKQFIPIFYDLNDIDREDYINKLQVFINYSKRFIVELENKSIELEKLIPRNKKKIEREYFDRLITQVSRYVKYQVSKYTISVSEFANLLADLRTYNEYLIRENGK